jgi:hypothetical protein
MIKKIYAIVIASLVIVSASFAQGTSTKTQATSKTDTTKSSKTAPAPVKYSTLDIHFSGLAFLDDHEYDAFIPIRKTNSGTRTAIDIGYNVDSLNHFVVGTSALHEFGGVPYFVEVNPVAYYSFKNKNWLFNAGEFPRDSLLQLPRGLYNVDSALYYRPNVEGLLLSHKGNHGVETGFIDWISRQTPTNRNQFMAGELGTYFPNPGHAFYITHAFLFEHNAGSKSDTAADIQDSGGGQVRLGLDYSHKTLFDSLKFEAGGQFTAHRTRSEYQFEFSRGFVATVYLGIKKFSLEDQFYKGDPSELTYADPFYRKSIFNRADFMYTAFVGKHLRGQFFLALYQSPGELSDSQPGFRLIYDIGRKTIAKFKDPD